MGVFKGDDNSQEEVGLAPRKNAITLLIIQYILDIYVSIGSGE